MTPLLKFALFALLFMATLCILSGHVSADTHTLAATGNADAGATWGGTAPEAGDDIVLTGAYNLALNQAITYGSVTLDADYSGVATQGSVNFGYTSFTMAAGTWTGKVGYTQTNSGNWTQIGGTVTNSVLQLVMTGDGKTISVQSQWGFACLRASANITWTSTAVVEQRTYSTTAVSLIVDSGKTLTVPSGKLVRCYCYGAGGVQILGSIGGDGTVYLDFYTADLMLTINRITAPVQIFLTNGAAASHTLTMAADSTWGSLTVKSNDPAKTMTLDTNGKSLGCTALTIGARGIVSSSVAGAEIDADSILVQANGKLDATNIAYIDDAGNWDTSAGTWVPDDCQVNMTGASKTLKTGNGQAFYYLMIGSGASTTLLSNVIVMSHLNIEGSSNGVTFRYNVSGASETCFEANGTFSNKVYLNGSAEEHTVYIGIPMIGTVYFDNNLTFITASGNLSVQPDNEVNITLKSWDGGRHLFAGCTVEDANVVFVAYSLTGEKRFAIHIDSEITEYKESTTEGELEFEVTEWSDHEILLTEAPLILVEGVELYYYNGSIEEAIRYVLNCTSDQMVVWTLDTDAEFLSWDGAAIKGLPGYFDSGSYSVILTAENDNGTTLLIMTLTVLDHPYGETTSLLLALMPIFVLMLIISYVFAYQEKLRRR